MRDARKRVWSGVAAELRASLANGSEFLFGDTDQADFERMQCAVLDVAAIAERFAGERGPKE